MSSPLDASKVLFVWASVSKGALKLQDFGWYSEGGDQYVLRRLERKHTALKHNLRDERLKHPESSQRSDERSWLSALSQHRLVPQNWYYVPNEWIVWKILGTYPSPDRALQTQRCRGCAAERSELQRGCWQARIAGKTEERWSWWGCGYILGIFDVECRSELAARVFL